MYLIEMRRFSEFEEKSSRNKESATWGVGPVYKNDQKSCVSTSPRPPSYFFFVGGEGGGDFWSLLSSCDDKKIQSQSHHF